MTNFDLNSYIRWLRPDHTSCNTSRQPYTALDTQQLTSSSVVPREETELSFLASNRFESFTTRNQDMESPSLFGPTIKSSWSSSSPTALKLLFRSSLFRELTERNLNKYAEEESLDPADELAELKETDGHSWVSLPFFCSSKSCPNRNHKGVRSPWTNLDQNQDESSDKFPVMTN